MANDFGITPEGFNLKKLPDIKTDLDERINLALNNQTALLPDSPEGQLSGLFSIIYSSLWEELQTAYDAFNPLSVIDQTQDNLVQLNGITRLVAKPSTVVLDLTGTDTTVIPANSIVSNSVTGAQFLTDTEVTIPASGTISVTARSSVKDIIVGNANDITVIETPLNGWLTANNAIDAVVGRKLETNAELRVRRSRSLSLSGQSSLGSIFAAVAATSGVSYVSISENTSDVVQPITGLPPHSFSVVVLGGQPQDIGDAIWNKKPIGILSFGDVDVNVLDIQGETHIVSFQTPIVVPIYVRANITFFVQPLPENAADVMSQAIVDYVEGKLIPNAGFGVGQDVVHSRIYTPLNLTFQGHTVNTLEISLDNSIWTSNDISIAFNQVSGFDISRITLTVS